ncbi:hypothetical protein CJ216_00505 [Gardnerella greenwoodii]|uniref:Uncharacterized protein n=1 Tax=Gardnerella greenwoodii TaxID=2914925 RepID=A0A2N6RX45_9BIFI|nr:hypothetical protein CJ216_00505 [Gardnerella greenwoodii]
MLYTSLLGRISLIYIYSMLSRTQKIRANNAKNLCAKRRFYKKLSITLSRLERQTTPNARTISTRLRNSRWKSTGLPT